MSSTLQQPTVTMAELAAQVAQLSETVAILAASQRQTRARLAAHEEAERLIAGLNGNPGASYGDPVVAKVQARRQRMQDLGWPGLVG